MDSDLAESLQALKSVFEKRKISAQFGAANPAVVESLRKTFRIPARYRAFLLEADPLKADVSKLDAEGDCSVYTAMNGAGKWEPRLCGSTFAQFLRILAVSMEVAQGFGEAIMDDDDEAAFRETLGHKIKTIDAAALRAGHWT